jgi:TetR/AcrR family transcriptional regulator, transcriptional repressor for nem operon
VARHREFDERVAIDAAVRRFWIYGYEATSVRDLARDMGITVASLYNAYGDKRALFRAALAHYVANSFEERVARFEQAMAPLAAVEAFMAEIIDVSAQDSERKGCLLVNSALEIAPHDAELRELVTEVLDKIEAFFFRCVSAGQEVGEITISHPATDLAKMLLGAHIGIRVLARTRPDRALLEGVARPVLTFLRIPRS